MQNLIIDNTPISVGASSPCDRKIFLDDNGCLILETTVATIILKSLFLGVLVSLGLLNLGYLYSNPAFSGWRWMGTVIFLFFLPGCGFLLVAYLVSRLFRLRVQFDMTDGHMTQYTSFGTIWERPLTDIIAVQLLLDDTDHGEFVSRTWQLNIVFREAEESRINLSNHTDRTWTLQAGRELAEFLHVPLINRISEALEEELRV